MTPHETGSTATPGASRAALPPRTFSPQGPTLGALIDAYLQDLPRPAVPVPEHRSRPDRPSRCLLRS